MAWLAELKAKRPMKTAKVGVVTRRPISPRRGGRRSALRPPGWTRASGTRSAMQPTIHQRAIHEPVAAMSAPTARLAAR